MPIEKNIDVDLLSVDLANFRLGEFDDVRSAYQAMLEEQKDKLVALAADILENGLSPAERLIVVPDEDEPKHFVVCEGNRRLTAIKFMSDPRLTASSLNTAALPNYQNCSIRSRLDPCRAWSWRLRRRRSSGLSANTIQRTARGSFNGDLSRQVAQRLIEGASEPPKPENQDILIFS